MSEDADSDAESHTNYVTIQYLHSYIIMKYMTRHSHGKNVAMPCCV